MNTPNTIFAQHKHIRTVCKSIEYSSNWVFSIRSGKVYSSNRLSDWWSNSKKENKGKNKNECEFKLNRIVWLQHFSIEHRQKSFFFSLLAVCYCCAGVSEVHFMSVFISWIRSRRRRKTHTVACDTQEAEEDLRRANKREREKVLLLYAERKQNTNRK